MWEIAIVEAWRNLRASLPRSLLALLGVLIGTCSVVAMLNVGAMGRAESAARFRALGTDLLVMQPSFLNAQSQDIRPSDVSAITTENPELRILAPYVLFDTMIVDGANQIDSSVIGATTKLLVAANLSVAEGRFISRFDQYERFAVIGSDLALSLGGSRGSVRLGDQIRIGAEEFVVAGILRPTVQSQLFPVSVSNSVIIPFRSMARLTPNSAIAGVICRVRPAISPSAASTKIQQSFGVIHPGGSLTFRTADDLIATATAQSDVYTIILGAVAAISMLVGGAGVMNVMLVAIAERRHEIGVRLAIGARQRDILTLFLAEAGILCFSGGAIGCLVGIGVSWLLARWQAWLFIVSGEGIVLAIVSATLVGLAAGVIPAISAARSDPINALRSA